MDSLDSSDQLILECPHCNNLIQILKSQINCAIFRHGVFKTTFLQMCPHESKENCDKFINEELIYGCGKPCKLIIENETSEEYKLIVCEYI